MALTVTETRKNNANSIIYNPKFLYVTPYVDGVPGTKTWQCMDIIRDSTTITQEDNTENPMKMNYLQLQSLITFKQVTIRLLLKLEICRQNS